MRFTYSVDELFDVMCVGFKNMPTESFKFCLERFKRHDIFGKTINLNVVPIDNHDEIVNFIFSGKHE